MRFFIEFGSYVTVVEVRPYCLLHRCSKRNLSSSQCIIYDDEWLLANKDYGKMKDAVTSGTRPSLDAITGPADLVSSLRCWIDRCWDKTPDLRPSFNGNLSPLFLSFSFVGLLPSFCLFVKLRWRIKFD